MNLLVELIGIVYEGLQKLSLKNLIVVLAAAVVLSGFAWALCNYYVLLWNKRFRLTATHQVLATTASLLTFFFVLAFAGMVFMQEIALSKIVIWRENLKNDRDWSQSTFKEAFYSVEKLGKEKDIVNYKKPEDGGNFIPLSQPESQLEAAAVYADNACENFDQKHPFLSKIIWSSAQMPRKLIKDDIEQWFNSRKGIYPFEKAIDLAAQKIKNDLTKQTPRIVRLARIALVILFLFVILIPLALIGYTAYRDIKVRV